MELLKDMVAEWQSSVVFRGRGPSHRRLHARVLLLLLLTLVVDVLAALLVALVIGEKDLNPPWKAFVWASSQLLAGGSSLAVTETGGHWVEVVLQFFDITVVAALAGSFAAFFHEREAEEPQPKNGVAGHPCEGSSRDGVPRE